jgi:hypothetical protein
MAVRTPESEDKNGIHGEPEIEPAFPIDDPSQEPKEGYNASNPGGRASKNVTQNDSDSGDNDDSPPLNEENDEKKADSPSALAQKEADGGGDEGSKSAVGGAEKSLYRPEAVAMAGMPAQIRAVNALRKMASSRKGQAGAGLGAIVGITIAFLIFAGGVAQLVIAKERILNHGNRFANTRLERQLTKTAAHMFRKMHDDATYMKKFDQAKFRTKMEKQGFKVDFDENTKTLRGLSYEFTDKNGGTQTRNFDFSKASEQSAKQFFGDDQIGRIALGKFHIATYSYAGMWRGGATTVVYEKFKVRFNNWTDETPSDKAKTQKQKFASLLRQQSADPSTSSSKGDPRQTAEDKKNNALIDPESDLGQEARDARQKLIDDPTLSSNDVSNIDADRAQAGADISRDIDRGMGVGEAIQKGLGSKPSAVLGKIAGSLNLAGTTADACALKGALSYAQYIKSTAMATQLAGFTFMLFTAADHQKAGLAAAAGTGILMQALNDRSSADKRSFWGSGGFLYAMGDSSAKPKASNQGLYNVGRSNQGILAKINDFVNTTPPFSQATSETTCKIATNKIVTIGGTAVGAVAAVFSLGTTATLNVASRLVMAGLQSVAVIYTQQQILKTASGFALDGLEDGEQLGDAFGSGTGTALAAVNGANGLMPVKNSELAALVQEADDQQRFDQSQKSFASRYFSLSSDSLLGNMILSRPQLAAWLSPASMVSSGVSLFSPATSLAALDTMLPNSGVAYAASNNCDDPQVKANDLATDPFCNPIVAGLSDLDIDKTQKTLTANGDIDPEGDPAAGSPYEKFQKQCLSGRPDLLYKDVSDASQDDILNGRANPTDKDNTCIESGPNKANGKDYPDGQYSSYRVWHTTRNQEINIIKNINDDFSDQGGKAPTNVPGPDTQIDPNFAIKKLSTPLPGADCDCKIDPKGITLHWWGSQPGTGIQSLVDIFKSNGLSTQIGITKDGEVYQLTKDLETKASHAIGGNATTFGIEIDGGPNDDFGPDGKNSNPKKFEAVVATVKYLMQKYNIPVDGPATCDNVVGIHPHSDYNSCPGAVQKSDVDNAYFNEVIKRVK